MKYYPLIISAPHVCTTVSKAIKKRLNLTDYQIWKLGDPFTKETSFHPKAFLHNIGNIHRLCCDLSLWVPPTMPFRTHDFYGIPIYKDKQNFTKKERQYFLDNYAKTFRQNIIKAISDLIKRGHKKILLIDHHNTAGDHSVNSTGEYMPMITICNGGEKNTGKKNKNKKISCPPEFLQTFKKSMENNLDIAVEINHVYPMSHTISWLVKDVRPQFPDIDLYGIFLEYNLNLIHNSISKKNDLQAKNILRKAINSGIDSIFQNYFKTFTKT